MTWRGPSLIRLVGAQALCLSLVAMPNGWATAGAHSKAKHHRTVHPPWQATALTGMSGDLEGVSCTRPRWCVAVGYDQSGTGEASGALALLYNGADWGAFSLSGAPTGTQLTSVSCWSSQACIAVGGALGWPFAARFDDGQWTSMPVPRPAQGTQGQLDGVACLSSHACLSVGSDLDASSFNSQAIVFWFNGKRWRQEELPAMAGGSVLSSASCAGAGTAPACLAVGAELNRSGFGPLALELSKGHWRKVAMKGGAGRLGSVSCPLAGRCLAVGTDGQHAVAWALKDGHWQRLPAPAGRMTGLSAVSCTAGLSWCATVGEHGGGAPGIAVWDGSHWAARAGPRLQEASTLSGVSCLRRPARGHSCVAVGTNEPPRSVAQPQVVTGS